MTESLQGLLLRLNRLLGSTSTTNSVEGQYLAVTIQFLLIRIISSELLKERGQIKYDYVKFYLKDA